MNEFELRRALGALPRSRPPGRDLWPAIAGRIERPQAHRQSARWPWLALAAAAVFAAVLLPARFAELDETATPTLTAEVAPPQATAGHDILVGSAWVLPTWMLGDPEVMDALAELEETTRELHHLIREHPEATHLVSLLHATYDQQRWLNRLGVGQGLPHLPQES